MKNRYFSRKIAQYIWNETEKLNDDELKQVILQFRELNQTNCSWLEYQLKDVMIEVAENQLKLNEDKRKAEIEKIGGES